MNLGRELRLSLLLFFLSLLLQLRIKGGYVMQSMMCMISSLLNQPVELKSRINPKKYWRYLPSTVNQRNDQHSEKPFVPRNPIEDDACVDRVQEEEVVVDDDE
jgi:hypothetical protein